MISSHRGRFFIRWLLCAVLTTLVLAPGQAAAWWNGDWAYRTKITIAAGQIDGAGRLPVLVRLHDGNFKFTDAKEDGSDLRFVAGDDKTPLKFHIESYDNLLGIAFVWVDVLPAQGGPTEFWLYYNNKNAPVGADPAGSYDAATGLVYHFAARNAPPRDETANNNAGLAPVKSVDTALIGRGAQFDGSTVIGVPASPSLAVAQGGAMTWSAWVKPAGAATGALYVRRDGANAVIIGLDQGKPYVAVTNNGTETRDGPAEALSPNWHHIAVTFSGQTILYVDGKAVTTLASPLPALNGGAASLGGDSASVSGTPPAGTPASFTGDMDEVAISKTVRSPGFIAAATAIQGPDSQVLSYGEGEENAGLSGGYFGVILRSVTVDGWVVIAILAVMALVSVIVMINKTRYVNRVARDNARFLALFEQAGTDMGKLQRLLGSEQSPDLDQSVLYRINEAGVSELALRSHGGVPALSAEAVATIRAKLDRISAYENQKLNSQLVLLTIAISGGPFLGLLGTVIGVMITFAAIAASGDVNINAIAPGIAAALVATVAGLGVAIPALFGYNYLVTRIKDMTTEMHVFTDEFVTRLAETYPPRGRTPSLAAE
ncbi:MAG TPA: DUF2341 domain-containing protein [Rhizomicrobium sp.]|nr:DUF2341 domain-containing protein [Rhizomicrobium sp.]